DRSRQPGSGRQTEQDQQQNDERRGPFADLRQLVMYRRHQRLQRKKAAGGEKAGGEPAQTAVPQSGGNALASDVRERMEGQVGADLSGVKIHTGGESASAARGFGARAFTVGQDVHFGAGEFAPGTKEGDRLLAHEL